MRNLNQASHKHPQCHKTLIIDPNTRDTGDVKLNRSQKDHGNTRKDLAFQLDPKGHN